MKKTKVNFPQPDYDDEVVFYVIYSRELEKDCIIGWSDDKDLAKSYYEFHKCKNVYMKKLEGIYEKIYDILKDYINEQIFLKKLKTIDNNKIIKLVVPITVTEESLIYDQIETMCSFLVNYHDIIGWAEYLDKDYFNALNYLYLIDIARAQIYGDDPEHDKRINIKNFIEFDEIKLLTRLSPTTFGMEEEI